MTRVRTVIHIGAEKTGTTALQRTFDGSLETLAAAGVHRPGEGIGWHTLPLYAMADGRSSVLGDRRPAFLEDRATWRKQIADRFARDLAAARPETLLLSSEFFAAQLIDTGEITRLRELLDRWTDEYVVVLYMRRQDRAAVSLYSTEVLAGSDSPDVFGPRPFTPMGFDYARVLDLWSEVFGADAVRPRVYETARERDGGLVADFVECSGLPVRPDALAVPPTPANPSLSAKAQRILLEFNRRTGGGAAVDPQDVIARRVVVGEARRLNPGPPNRPARAEARAYLERFADGNARVAQTWFDRDELFDDSFDEYPEVPEPVPPVELSDVVDVAAGLAAQVAENRLAAQERRRRQRAARQPPKAGRRVPGPGAGG